MYLYSVMNQGPYAMQTYLCCCMIVFVFLSFVFSFFRTNTDVSLSLSFSRFSINLSSSSQPELFPIISVAQVLWDATYDQHYQSRFTFVFRCVVGYGLILGGTWGLLRFAEQHQQQQPPQHNINVATLTSTTPGVPHHGLGWVIFHAALQGIGGAILYGMLNQLSSFVGNSGTTPTTTTSGINNSNNNNNNNNTTTNINTNEKEDERLSKQLKATVSAGVQASALVVFLASIGSGFGTMNGSAFPQFVTWIFVLELLCFGISLYLLVACPRIQASLTRRDSSLILFQASTTTETETGAGCDGLFTAILPASSSSFLWNEDEEQHGCNGQELQQQQLQAEDDSLRQPLLLHRSTFLSSSFDGSKNSSSSSAAAVNTSLEMSVRDLVYRSRYCCWGLGMTLIPSFLVGAWFTHVHTSWMYLAQILFYTRIGCDFLGRVSTILIPPTSIECVVRTALLRLLAVVVFFINASASSRIEQSPYPYQYQYPQHQRDMVSILLVAVIAFCSGYLVTACYQLAPQQITLPTTRDDTTNTTNHAGADNTGRHTENNDEIDRTRQAQQQLQLLRNANATKQSAILTVAFSLSAICGLVLSFVFIAIGV